MSIFAKTFSKLKQTNPELAADKRKADNVQPILPKEAVTAEGDGNIDSGPDLENLDIPLDQDLTRSHGVVKDADDSAGDIDFDLTASMDSETLFPESQVLAINPLKAFSQQIDLDLKSFAKQGFINPNEANTPLSSAFRMIKRPLLNNAMGKGASVVDNGNLIMMTSSVGGEGKTFSAINLAISIAMEKEKHVLLIDADVNKPSHHSVFGIEMQYGLTDYLLGEVDDMSHVLLRTNIPSLSLMFAGKQTALATELLASDAMAEFVKDISTRYPDRVIIFDSPPLLMTTESNVLASHMGQVILVVEAEKTFRSQVSKSLSLLNNEIVLILLNKMRQANETANYGYYGYGQQS